MPLNIDWQQILLHVFNLIILVTGLTFILFKPVRKFMRDRQEKYKKTAEEHAKMQEELAGIDAERERRRAAMESEAAERKRRSVAEAERERSKILASAQAEAGEILSDGRRRAESEREAMFAEARGELGDIVVRSAEKLLAIESSPESDKALYDKYLKAAQEGVSLKEASKAAMVEYSSKNAAQNARRAAEEQVRAELAELLGDAALDTLKKERTADSDGAIYDKFLKTVSEGGTK